MTLDEAIKHCEEVASSCDNKNCALDHKQLAEWLKELKMIKNSNYTDKVSGCCETQDR